MLFAVIVIGKFTFYYFIVFLDAGEFFSTIFILSESIKLRFFDRTIWKGHAEWSRRRGAKLECNIYKEWLYTPALLDIMHCTDWKASLTRELESFGLQKEKMRERPRPTCICNCISTSKASCKHFQTENPSDWIRNLRAHIFHTKRIEIGKLRLENEKGAWPWILSNFTARPANFQTDEKKLFVWIRCFFLFSIEIHILHRRNCSSSKSPSFNPVIFQIPLSLCSTRFYWQWKWYFFFLNYCKFSHSRVNSKSLFWFYIQRALFCFEISSLGAERGRGFTGAGVSLTFSLSPRRLSVARNLWQRSRRRSTATRDQ